MLFAPRSVAVIGATSRAGSVGQAVFANVFKHGYAGVVYPVNPRSASVMSVKAFPSVLDIPDPVDLSIIIVPSPLVPGVMEECGKKGIKAAIVITAGFKELGGAGVEQEQSVLTAARQNGIRLLGPNCLGIINTDPQVSLNGSFARLMPATGNIALVSQSGAVGVAALEYAQGEGIGLSKFVSVGNKADLNENDFLAYLKDDPLTDVIMFYLEDLSDPKRFFQLAREITGEAGNKKPILAIKSGRTAAGARAASSHTGALAGSDEAYDALFAQCGVLRVESLEELFDYAQAFSTQPLPQGQPGGHRHQCRRPGHYDHRRRGALRPFDCRIFGGDRGQAQGRAARRRPTSTTRWMSWGTPGRTATASPWKAFWETTTSMGSSSSPPRSS